MKPRITVLTLGVDNLEKSVEFYRDGLGFPTEGIIGKEFEYGAVAFFDLENGCKLALWPRKSIAKDTGLNLDKPSATELTIGYNVENIEEVNTIMELAEKAGAKILKPAENTFWGGYSGYFQDLDNHIWEIVFNPDFR
ncbi:VOC family protein [Elizabethkingia anophelis]|uniref:VOC family protein n=1 Tax=Elizabethkingia TaxID=308865 RepID=UPI00073985A1|nr:MULTISPECIES: VOC family protein [Elizabethkingia]KUF47247.1 glyoxalase [Elizabethkingia anophelis]MCT3711488.1 VOC family protein [Elizabethkingia anophelis]MCT3903823.1 VOC family protein [Elizabethkingia anophelis]MCT3935990.1 VOC family protein [Elizabethkingia anophelis]MCT3971692.1 VOC family protein [Elizabethkingia anophelis]